MGIETSFHFMLAGMRSKRSVFELSVAEGLKTSLDRMEKLLAALSSDLRKTLVTRCFLERMPFALMMGTVPV